MINERDIEYMRNAHRQIYKHRMKKFTIVFERESEEEDPFGETQVVEEVREVEGVVTFLSAYTNVEELGYYGYVYADGDVKFDVDETELPVTTDTPKYIEYQGTRYRVKYAKPKGIGVRNRTEFIGRVVT